MLRTRVIPCLQLVDQSLVKAYKFKKFNYVGDPANTVRIFNELEVDELCFLDIRATREGRGPNFKVLQEIADECFMPLSYGGGIRDFATAKKILSTGFEKIVINTSAIEDPSFITKLANHFGNQSVIVSIDVKRGLFGKYRVYSHDGKRRTVLDPVVWAKEAESLGAGELLVTAMDREGTWEGYDCELLRQISKAVTVPVIAHGGAGSIADIAAAVKKGGASAVAVGSLVVYQKRGMGVLVNFPDKKKLERALKVKR